MFQWYKYLIVNLVFSHLGFWSGNLFLIAPFPDLCLLVSFLFQHKVPATATDRHTTWETPCLKIVILARVLTRGSNVQILIVVSTYFCIINRALLDKQSCSCKMAEMQDVCTCILIIC